VLFPICHELETLRRQQRAQRPTDVALVAEELAP